MTANGDECVGCAPEQRPTARGSLPSKLPPPSRRFWPVDRHASARRMPFSLESDTLTRIPTGGVVGGHGVFRRKPWPLESCTKPMSGRWQFLADEKRRNASGRHQEVVDGQMESEAIRTVPPLRSTGGPLKSTADRKCVSRYPPIYGKEGPSISTRTVTTLKHSTIALNVRPVSSTQSITSDRHKCKDAPYPEHILLQRHSDVPTSFSTFHKCQCFSMALRSGSGGWYFPKTMRNTRFCILLVDSVYRRVN